MTAPRRDRDPQGSPSVGDARSDPGDLCRGEPASRRPPHLAALRHAGRCDDERRAVLAQEQGRPEGSRDVIDPVGPCPVSWHESTFRCRYGERHRALPRDDTGQRPRKPGCRMSRCMDRRCRPGPKRVVSSPRRRRPSRDRRRHNRSRGGCCEVASGQSRDWSGCAPFDDGTERHPRRCPLPKAMAMAVRRAWISMLSSPLRVTRGKSVQRPGVAAEDFDASAMPDVDRRVVLAPCQVFCVARAGWTRGVSRYAAGGSPRLGAGHVLADHRTTSRREPTLNRALGRPCARLRHAVRRGGIVSWPGTADRSSCHCSPSETSSSSHESCCHERVPVERCSTRRSSPLKSPCSPPGIPRPPKPQALRPPHRSRTAR